MTRLRASLFLACLFAGGLIAGACHDEPVYTPPVGSVCDLQEVRQ